ncbi:MAG: gamma-glutamyltransferase family protein [Candidatus Rokubacteria bacterium]|nr:gamma-glutamyltransferase family protein [Candidatus Rokubacteria bacterium]
MRILDAGGNAIDAGVAAGLALGVLQPDIVGFAGVAPIILYLAEKGTVTTISGLGRWPRRADVSFFERHANGRLPLGVLRSVVPASIDAWVTALEQFGTRSFTEVAQASFVLAEEGFAAHELLCETIAEDQALYAQWPSSASIFLRDGRPPSIGEPFRQPDLARTIRRLMEAEGREAGGRLAGLAAVRKAFYDGPIAEEIVAFYEREGGLLTAQDLREFRVGIEPPVSTTFQGYEVYSCGPWCQGAVLLEFLNMLEGDDLKTIGCNSPDYIHLLTEVMKLGFADREAYFGDPEFVAVPIRQLVSKAYARDRRKQVSADRASPSMPPSGDPGRSPSRAGDPAAVVAGRSREARDTTYLCVVDRHGNGFSATPSDGYSTAPVIPGLGFAVSPRGDQSWLQADHPSSIGPWKRPRLTPNPALALKDGHLAMVFGTPGGDVQCQTMLQFFLNVVVFGMNPQAAVETPRFASYSFPNSFYPHHSEPGVLRMEKGLESAADRLKERGHVVELWPHRYWRAGGLCAVVIDGASGYRIAGADPRRECYALAW